MRVGIVGDGIVGTAIAATLAKHQPFVDVTLIDDGRPNKTSKAGQGYLWSINRFDDPIGLKTSILAKTAWMDLLGYTEIDDSDYPGDSKENDTFSVLKTTAPSNLLQKRGSMLIAPRQNASSLLDYYNRAKNSPYLPDLRFVEDASHHNVLLKSGSFCGILNPNDYTCNPPQLIQHLKAKFELEVEHRTVTDLGEELNPKTIDGCIDSKFDCIICCAGPWINELEDVHVEPVRGLLLEAAVGYLPGTYANPTLKAESENIVVSLEDQRKLVPLMEFGYGSLGVHFTLSSRDGTLLIGASRESVGFSTIGLDEVEAKLLEHADDFLVEGAIRQVSGRRLGFRPACDNRIPKHKQRTYCIQRSTADERIVLVYGFEGQGVLYAPLAAKDVMEMIEFD